jgi:hypothetical protein
MANIANAARPEAGRIETKPAPGQSAAGVQKIAGYTIDNSVLSGIRQASKKTGVDFGYLMAQAAQESSFQPEVKAGTTSATGLYQFIESTWLGMVKNHGGKHGLQAQADKIVADSRGGYTVADPGQRKAILELRKDPKAAAVIGAEFALSNKDELERNLGRPVGSTELYFAHFLGAGGATRFLRAIDRNANQSAADLLPQAAESNQTVFWDGNGRARSVGELYGMFRRSIESKSEQFAKIDVNGLDALLPQGAAGRPGPARLQRTSPQFGPTVVAASRADVDPKSLQAARAKVDAVIAANRVSLMTMLSLAALDVLRQPTDGARSGDGFASVTGGDARRLGMRAYRSI